MFPSRDEVHMWVVRPEAISDPALLERYRAMLSPEERAQEVRFKFQRDQKRYLLTRALVRSTLSRYVGIEPEQWSFVTNAYGRPEIAEMDLPLSFNVSHTVGAIVLAVASSRVVGVDIENTRREQVPLDIADSYFAPKEVSGLRLLPSRQQPQRFFELWTLKESYIKAVGKGLSIPLDAFAFSFVPAGRLGIEFSDALDDSPRRWEFWLHSYDTSFVTALCVERATTERTTMRTWEVVPLMTAQSIEPRLLRQSALGAS